MFLCEVEILYCHTLQLVAAVRMSLTKAICRKRLPLIVTAEALKHYLVDAASSWLSYSTPKVTLRSHGGINKEAFSTDCNTKT